MSYERRKGPSSPSTRPQQARGASRRSVAPGKRTLTQHLPSRPQQARAVVQQKPDPAVEARRAARAEQTARWMDTAIRPDLHPPPVQRKRAGEAPGRASSTPAGGQPLPEDVQAKMERAFDADFSAVRVHEGAQAPALGALAYTQGTDIHFAPGTYAPGSQRGQELLGHELTHVVQQAEGRVAGTTQAKGAIINDDAALEREADEMGARAARGEHVRRGAQPGGEAPASQARRAQGASAGVVQREVGLEIESTPDWQAYDPEYQAILGEHRVLYSEGQFRLETELSGKLEFVIEPPSKDTGELLGIMDRVVEVARAIEAAKPQKTQKTVRDDFASEYLQQEVHKKVDLFLLSKAVPGALDGVYVSRGPGAFFGGFQATVGVHLSAVPFLFERLQRGDLIDNYPSGEAMKGAASTAEGARRESVGLPYTGYHQISPEMEGLLDLVYYYIAVGGNAGRRPFPKGLTQVMARTNFAKMLSMTPEAALFAEHPDLWVEYVTEAGGLDPDAPVFRGRFGDTEEKAATVDLTIGEWLVGMAKGVDRLSVKGDGPEILKTMGDLSKTDDLGAEGDENRGVILELRGLDQNTIPIGQWIRFAYKISHMIDQLHSRNTDPNQARKDVEQAGRGDSLYWSTEKRKREAGEDVQRMSIEALHAPFVSQVVGLYTRAKARAESVDD